MYKNNTVTIVAKAGNFYKIKFGNGYGYISNSSSYVTIQTPTPIATVNTVKETAYNATAKIIAPSGLNVRKSASETATRIGGVNKNNTVTIVAKAGNFYKIKFGNGYGYISSNSSYITIQTSKPPTTPVSSTKKHSLTAKTTLYQTASFDKPYKNANGAIVQVAPQTVTVLTQQGDWLQISSSVGKAWVNVKDPTGAKQPKKHALTAKSTLYQTASFDKPYKNANGTIVQVAPQTVTVLTQQGDWLQISSSVGKAWVNVKNPVGTPNKNPFLTNLPSLGTNHIKRTYQSDVLYQKAMEFGLKLTSAYRDPVKNQQVGGSKTSDHIQGQAYDFAGTWSQMAALADWAHKTGNYKQVIFNDKDYRTGARITGHKDHVHIAWNGSGSPSQPSRPELLVGSGGEAVKTLQRGLKQLGYSIGTVDGIFGTNTKNVVIQFQKSKKLTADGIVGSKTWVALDAALAPAPKPTVPTKPELTPINTSNQPLIKEGSTGDAVKTLQQRLKQLGYSIGVDGIFGKNTKNVVIQFQKSKKLTADGIVGSKTWVALDAALAPAPKPTVPTKPVLTPINTSNQPLIKEGSTGDAVKTLQQRLKQLGYSIGVDGIFGKSTKNVVIQFQKSKKLTADGMVGTKTWEALGIKSTPKPQPTKPNPPKQTQTLFEKALDFVLDAEGGYTVDSGGPTNLGVTKTTYDEYNRLKGKAKKSVESITRSEAVDVYKTLYWDKIKSDRFVSPLAVTMFDTAVNYGVGGAVKFMQRVLGISADGVWGSKTEAAYVAKEKSLNTKDTALRIIKLRYDGRPTLGGRYNPNGSDNLNGWRNRDNNLKVFVSTL